MVAMTTFRRRRGHVETGFMKPIDERDFALSPLNRRAQSRACCEHRPHARRRFEFGRGALPYHHCTRAREQRARLVKSLRIICDTIQIQDCQN